MICSEKFAYGRINLTVPQPRLVEARETAVRREGERHRRWAARARATVTAECPVAPEDHEEELPSVEEERPLLLQRGQEEALVRQS